MRPAESTRNAAPLWSTLLLSTALLCGCNNEAAQVVDVPRPATVPADAKFVGGSDGGVFLSIETLGNDTYQIKVYLDSGPLAYAGPAKASAGTGGKLTVDDVAGWDGEQLQLTNGGSLIPTEPLKRIQTP